MSHTAQRLKAEMLAGENGKDSPSQGADYRTLREYNHLLVLNSIRLQGPIARVAIASQTGLSKTTVSSIIDQLLQDGLVTEGDFLDSAPTGGRRAVQVHFNADAGIILGVDVGRTHITVIATNLGGEVKTVHTEAFDITSNPAKGIPIILTSIRVFLAKAGLSWDQIIGVGVGIPATIDAQTHTFIRPPAMETWDGIDLPAILSREFQAPAFIDNNANLGALSEARYGVGKLFSNFVYVTVESGIGCGLIQNHQIYRGFNGMAGELGHIQIDDNGPPCSCGKTGCLERLADIDAIIDDASSSHSLRKISPLPRHQARPSPLARYDEVDINDVIHAAENGDPASRAAVQTAAHYLGVAISTLINLLNPGAIVLDGAVIRTGHLFLDTLKQAAAAGSLPALWPRTQLLVGQLGDLAVALGAATLVIDAAFAPVVIEYPTQLTRVFP